ncbi:hypothetical protein JOF53_005386 [Crossiella equi]|uniref:DUF4878 domain-containing protein n=1 Tax=Crossiella equi TaxID=130796 RepID=A0ABS5AJX8_9PSEU|nr:hypothetical protein [Crossiella equi]MBP2476514.1 hypothetical protein [Crossiella equi]
MIINKLRSVRVWIPLFAIVWIAVIVTLIAGAPAKGAQTVDELAVQVTEALAKADSGKLAELASFDSGADEAAQALVTGFAEAGASEFAATSELVHGRQQLAVAYLRADSSRAVVHLATLHTDGLWKVTPVPLP